MRLFPELGCSSTIPISWTSWVFNCSNFRTSFLVCPSVEGFVTWAWPCLVGRHYLDKDENDDGWPHKLRQQNSGCSHSNVNLCEYWGQKQLPTYFLLSLTMSYIQLLVMDRERKLLQFCCYPALRTVCQENGLETVAITLILKFHSLRSSWVGRLMTQSEVPLLRWTLSLKW